VVTLTLESRLELPKPAATKPEGSQDAPLERLVHEDVVEVGLVSLLGVHEESTRKLAIPPVAKTDVRKKADLKISHPPTLRL
jgi:hypothetical protein